MDENGTGTQEPSNETFNFEPPFWRWNVWASIFMAVVGVLANSALLLVILMNRHLRTTSNILVGNLAIADLVMFIFSVPMNAVMWLFVGWPGGAFGSFLCKLGGGGWALGQTVCATSLTAVSIERYFSLQMMVQTKRTVVILVVVWLIGLCFSLPLFFLGHTMYEPTIDMNFCRLLPDTLTKIRAYVTAYAVLTYFLPVVIIICCYVGMARVLFGRTGGESVEVARTRRRLAIVVLSLAVAFTVFWFPYHFVNMYFLYTDEETIRSVNFAIYMRLIEISHVLIYVNSCLNPFVVFFISGMHRKPLLDFLCCRKKISKASERHYAPVPDSVYAETVLSTQ